MPLVNGELITPDEAISHDLCPETGQPLKGVNIGDHIARLWRAPIDPGPPGDEPRRRIKLLKEWAKSHASELPQYDEDTGALLKR